MGARLLLSTPSRIARAEAVAERLELSTETARETMRAWLTFRLIEGGIPGRPRPVSLETRRAAIFNHRGSLRAACGGVLGACGCPSV
jgi:hypothetical protein